MAKPAVFIPIMDRLQDEIKKDNVDMELVTYWIKRVPLDGWEMIIVEGWPVSCPWHELMIWIITNRYYDLFMLLFNRLVDTKIYSKELVSQKLLFKWRFSLAIFKELISNIDVNIPNKYGQTLLHKEVLFDCIEKVKLLLDNGAHMTCDNDGNSCLNLNIFSGISDRTDFNIPNLLLELGCDINHANNNGDTCISYAVQRGSPNIIKWLLDNGAKIPLNYTFPVK